MLSIRLTEDAKANLLERIENNPKYPNARILVNGYT